RAATAAATERGAGVLRSEAGLRSLLDDLASVTRHTGIVRDLATIEATNLHTVSTLVASAALERSESRGCHQRVDCTATAGVPIAVVRVHVARGGAVVTEKSAVSEAGRFVCATTPLPTSESV
ncbi:MAG: hypothetical protein ACYCXY_08080, partial [Acidimicrobiales bacterium]